MSDRSLGIGIRLSKWVSVAEKLFNLGESMSSIGVTRKVLGSIIAVGAVTDVLMPRYYPEITLRRNNFVKFESDAVKFFIGLLSSSNFKSEVLDAGEFGSRIELWTPPGMKHSVLATTANLRWSENNLFVREGYDPAPLFQALVWSKGGSVMVTTTKGKTDTQYDVRPMTNDGFFVGTPSPTLIANRLRKARHETRSLLLVGPTGSGKSTMAKLIANEIAGPEARTLKIAGSLIKTCPFEVVIDIATMLQPTVLLLDDVPIDSYTHMDGLLALFEALHGKTKLIISTYMDDSRTETDIGDGSCYWSGMRPGRIDEVVLISRPSPENRELILRQYLNTTDLPMADIVKACDGLTGAYLKEVAYRINLYGKDSWQEEVRLVRQTAPFLYVEEEDPEEGTSKVPTRKDPIHALLRELKN